MGKVQILAVLTMDGCLSSELYDKAHQDLCLDRCGLDEIRKKALYRVTPDYSISMLHEWRKDGTNIRYLAEATLDVETERRVLRNIMTQKPNKTCIVTTHRPSVLNMCRRVYRVMDTRVTELSEEEAAKMAMDF